VGGFNIIPTSYCALLTKYYENYKIKEDGVGHAARSANILVRKPERKRPLGRYRSKWEGNIKINSLKKQNGRVWIGCFSLRVESNGGL
jgi:hypothetical protein